MKNKVTILTNLSEEITPISISDLNIIPQLPLGITTPNNSYGGFIPIHYNIDYDINFSAVKFYLNDELIHTSNKPTDTFNINVTSEFNKLSGYSENRFNLKLPQTEFEVIFKTTLDQTKTLLQISKILKYNLPNFILDDYPVFVDFIEAYYEFLEKSNNPNLIHYNLENYKDIDTVPEYIVDYFRKELIPNFHLNLAKDRQTGESLNERVLIKHIKEFYDSKGTENAIKFLFRILFDKEATIFYPKVNLIKPSDGVWTIDKTIDVYGTDIVRLYSLVGTTIYQRQTTGQIESHAIIKNVNVKKIPGGFQGSLFLYELSGTFSNTTPILLQEVLDGVSVETPLTVIKILNKNLTISPGRRDSLGGNLSETKRLIPDNDYWQNASYDVQGDADPKSFISIIKKLAHPAGFKMFGSYSPTLKLSKTINILKITNFGLQDSTNFNINPYENSKLTIGNYLPYSSDTVQDLNFLKTDNTDDNTDITTYRAFPNGLPFGKDGRTPTDAAKNYIDSILNIAKINITQSQVQLNEQEVYFRPNLGFQPGVPESTITSNGKLTSVITNIGQLIENEELSERWECGIHPRTILNLQKQIYPSNTAFGDLKISDFLGEEDPRSDRERQSISYIQSGGKKIIIEMDKCWQEQRDFWNAWWNFEKYGTRFGGGNSKYPPYGRCFGTTIGGQYCLSDIEYLKDQWEACRNFNSREITTTVPTFKVVGGGDPCSEMARLHTEFKELVIHNDFLLKVKLSEVNRQYEVDMNWAYMYFAGTALISLCSGQIGGGAAKAYYWMKAPPAGKVIRVMDEVIVNVGKMSGVGTLSSAEVVSLSLANYDKLIVGPYKFTEVGLGWALNLRMVRPTEIQLITGECIAAGVTPYQVLTKLQIEGFNNFSTLYKTAAQVMGVRTPTQATSQWMATNFSTLAQKMSMSIEKLATSSEAANGIFYKLTSKVLWNDWRYSATAFERLGYFNPTIANRCLSGGTALDRRLGPISLSKISAMEAAVNREFVVKVLLEANVNVPAVATQAAKNVSYAAALTAGISNVASDAWGVVTGSLFTGQLNKANEDYMAAFKLYNEDVVKYSEENTAKWNEFCEARDKCNMCNNSGSGSPSSGFGSQFGSVSTSGGYSGSGIPPGLRLLDDPIDPIDPEIINDNNNTIDGLITSSIIKYNIEQSSEDIINLL